MGSGQPGCLDAMECRYYDHSTSAWSTEGCMTTQYNRSGAGCGLQTFAPASCSSATLGAEDGRATHRAACSSCSGGGEGGSPRRLTVATSRAREETHPFPPSGVTAIGCSCNHLSDFVAVKVPTSLREKLDLALINVPRSRSGAMARPKLRPVP